MSAIDHSSIHSEAVEPVAAAEPPPQAPCVVTTFDVLDYSKSLEENVVALADMAARTLDAESCSITLFSEDRPSKVEPNVHTQFCIPTAKERRRLPSDPPQSPAPAPATRTEARHAVRSVGEAPRIMCSPIAIDGELLGMIKISNPKSKPGFSAQDLGYLEILTLYISKSIQVVQLRNVLKSRFAQISLVQGMKDTAGDALVNLAQQPEQMVKIIVKSFYQEMTRAGFGPRQMINAASGIIAELSNSLQRHSKRLDASDRQPGSAGQPHPPTYSTKTRTAKAHR